MKTFPLGGIHPDGNKLSAGKKIEIAPVPNQLIIPLSQCLGAPSVPIVEKGDTVKAGQLIAKGEAFISANLHSPVSGTVAKIDDVVDVSGTSRTCIIIDNDHNDVWMENIVQSDGIIKEITASSKEIVDKIKELGIVGMGGATFPTHVKLLIPDDKKVDYLIINGVECEPFLTSDHRIMLEHPEEILIGITILMRALQTDKAVIGIECNKLDAIDILKKASAGFSGITVEALKMKYPQGGEKQLIKAITGKSVPSGKLPLEVGCVVSNVGTAFAVYEAIQKNKPLIERVVTITGKEVKEPSNLLVRIGTPINELLSLCGGMPENTGKVISGGPMMGKALTNTFTPITKGMSGILFMPENNSSRKTVLNCIRCGRCINVCPMGLEPYLLAILSDKNMVDKMESEKIMDCIECGSCQYTCPSNRPLLDFIRLGKTNTSIVIRNRKK